MNPYDFVRIPKNVSVKRDKPIKHHRFADSLKHGRMVCKITTLTPLFIPNTDKVLINAGHKEAPFLGTVGISKHINGKPKIPGSSIKGVIRSVAEAAGNGCFLHKNCDLPRGANVSFEPCSDNNKLCITCRIFGMIGRGSIHKGKISINEAETEIGSFQMMGAHTLKPLMTPKPTHTAFYSPGGRKFYFHHYCMTEPLGGSINHWTKTVRDGYNSTINPVAPGGVFKFDVDFTNLTDEEFALLIYSFALEPSMRHKMGLAKPLGLGSVQITIETIILINPLLRYSTQQDKDQVYEGGKLEKFINDTTKTYRNSSDVNLVDLRRIWEWDSSVSEEYKYPTQHWFANNSQVPISGTP